MNAQEIRKIIENRNLSQAAFDCDLVPDFGILPEFNRLYDTLPEWLQEGINNGDFEIEENWDPEYWGSNSVLQLAIRGRGAKYQKRLDAWKDEDENEKVYCAFCSGLERAVWGYMKKQENFKAFDAAVKGK
jgi:hypothetical protein